jgi:hypothetical protein
MTGPKALAPSFGGELTAAGLGGLPLIWGSDGKISGRDNLSAEQNAALDAVIAAHDPVRSGLVAYARDKRWQVEVGGIVVGGVPVATDDRSKVMIVGARLAAQADPAWSTIWQGSDGQAYPVDAAAMLAISDGVRAHVNASFATLASVAAGIEAGTIADTAGIDAAFIA